MTAAVARPAPRQWTAALFVALLLHAGLAVVFHRLLDTGTAGPGLAGLEVGLGPAGGAPGEASGAVSPQEVEEVAAEETATVDPAPAELAEAQPAEPAPVAAQAAAPSEAVPLYAPKESPPVAPQEHATETVVAETPPPEIPEAAAAEVPEVVAAEAMPAEPLETSAGAVVAEPAMEIPEVPRAKPTPSRVAEPLEPPPAPVEEVETAQAPHATPTTQETAAAATEPASAAEGPPREPAEAGSEGKAGKGAQTAYGRSESRSGGGNPGAVVDYDARLHAWLLKHKVYPRRARLRRQEGVAMLYFVIDRGGNVLDFRVEQSSGYKLLDQEVLDMVKRASPLPAPPESVKGEILDYWVPIEFNQR